MPASAVRIRARQIRTIPACTRIQARSAVHGARSMRAATISDALTIALAANTAVWTNDNPADGDAAQAASGPVLATCASAAITARSSRKSTFGVSSATASWRARISSIAAPFPSHAASVSSPISVRAVSSS